MDINRSIAHAMFTSRSSIELYQTCPRKRFLHDFAEGTGVVPAGRSPHLVTGTAVHEGVGHLMKRLKLDEATVIGNQEHETQVAVDLATNWFTKECQDRQFYGKGVKTDQQQEFTFKEQLALVEALVRAWAMAEMPKVIDRYTVVGTEREVVVPLCDGVNFQARVDAELQDKRDSSFYNYSLKTCKEWTTRMEASYREDLQGITEIWAVEEESRQLGQAIETARSGLLAIAKTHPSNIIKDNIRKVAAFYQTLNKPKRLMGIRFCFLVKGQRKQSDPQDENSIYVTYSPLIRGYKRFTPSSVEYAHSWFFPNPENRSGKGALGKGWEPFNVWGSKEFTVKSWIDFIKDGQIQPECGDVVKAQVVTPVEYFRHDEEVKEGVEEIRSQEADVYTYLKGLELQPAILPRVFPKFRRSCHWPDECEYHKICYQKEVAEDILGSGYYERRVPHHKAEREAMSGKES